MFKVLAGILIIAMSQINKVGYNWSVYDICLCIAYATIGAGLDTIFRKK